jgi:hypothetical protein
LPREVEETPKYTCLKKRIILFLTLLHWPGYAVGLRSNKKSEPGSDLHFGEVVKNLEATMGFEPMIRVLQTLALPLGHVAREKKERAKGLEPTTFSLARRRSTN